MQRAPCFARSSPGQRDGEFVIVLDRSADGPVGGGDAGVVEKSGCFSHYRYTSSVIATTSVSFDSAFCMPFERLAVVDRHDLDKLRQHFGPVADDPRRVFAAGVR